MSHLNYAPNVRNASNGHPAPEGFTNAQWHVDATADANASHSRPGRLYVIQCEWCEEAFAAYTFAQAMNMFDQHQAQMYAEYAEQETMK